MSPLKNEATVRIIMIPVLVIMSSNVNELNAISDLTIKVCNNMVLRKIWEKKSYLL